MSCYQTLVISWVLKFITLMLKMINFLRSSEADLDFRKKVRHQKSNYFLWNDDRYPLNDAITRWDTNVNHKNILERLFRDEIFRFLLTLVWKQEHQDPSCVEPTEVVNILSIR